MKEQERTAVSVAMLMVIIIVGSFIGSMVLFDEEKQHIYEMGFNAGYDCGLGWYNPITQERIPMSNTDCEVQYERYKNVG